MKKGKNPFQSHVILVLSVFLCSLMAILAIRVTDYCKRDLYCTLYTLTLNVSLLFSDILRTHNAFRDCPMQSQRDPSTDGCSGQAP